MSSENFSRVLLRKLRTLSNRVNSLQREISSLEATVSQVVISQEDRISELECHAHPFGGAGEAICNWLDFDEAE